MENHHDINAIIRESLLKLATGYDYDETDVVADNKGRTVLVRQHHRHQPPSLAAIRELERRSAQTEVDLRLAAILSRRN